ncbi:hypothetical protein [Sphingomonas sp.]|uniref:hypothetical protein n=1 Tax=Sphingomonas sp. TaxID=28214 RepID=UPI00286BE29A|nr:hypothetical protein [Sphingomonas sp.]
MVKTPFTISPLVRYAIGMVIVALAALAATLVPQAPTPVSPGRQAQATVTILASASLRFSDIARDHPKKLRETLIRAADGSVQTVKLVEFE